MEHVKAMLDAIRRHLPGAAMKDLVASKPLSVNGQHVLVLSEFSIGFGAGGGSGDGGKATAKGAGGVGGGGAKASPVAVLVVEQGKVRLERIGG